MFSAPRDWLNVVAGRWNTVVDRPDVLAGQSNTIAGRLDILAADLHGRAPPDSLSRPSCCSS